MLFYKYTIRAKLFFISILLVLTSLILAIPIINYEYDVYRESIFVFNLGDLSASASKLIHSLQKERGLTSGYLASNKQKFSSELSNQMKESNTFRNELEKLIQNDDAQITKEIENLKLENIFNSIDKLRESIDNNTITASEAINHYSKIIENLIEINRLMVDKSMSNAEINNLSRSYFYFTKILENTGKMRANVNRILTVDSIDFVGHYNVSLVYHQNNLLKKEFEKYSFPEFIDKFNKLNQEDNSTKVLNTVELIIKNYGMKNLEMEPKEWFDRATRYIDDMISIENEMVARILSIANNEKAESKSALIWLSIIIIFWLGIIIILNFYIVNKISKNINYVTQKIVEISKGKIDI